MKQMKKKVMRILKYFIPSIIVIGILLVVFLLKGIYPFGSMTIVHGDLFQMFSPFYMHLWDFFHNGTSILYEYNIGLGGNLFGWEVLFGIFGSPITWLVGLTQRSNIVNFLSWILVLRVSLIALTTYIFFNKVYPKTKVFFKTIFSVMFALSGYVLINHTNFIWLDNVILFPILILGIKKIVEEKKIWLYVLILFLNLIICYQIAYAIIFAIISCMIFYLLLYVDKKERKKIAFLLGIGTVLAILLSSFLLLPGLTQSLESYRLSGSVFNDAINSSFLYKTSFLLLSPIALVGFVGLQTHISDDKKNIIFFDLMLLVTGIIPILIERTNLYWHAGSYLSFAFRFGFIPIFVLLNGGLYYFSKYYKERRIKVVWNDNTKIRLSLFLLIAIISIYVMYKLFPKINYNMPAMFLSSEACVMLVLTIIILVLGMLFSINMKVKKLQRLSIIIILLISTVGFSICYIGVEPQYRGGKEWSDEVLEIANNLMEDFDLETDSLYRYRDAERMMNENYPLIMNIPSLSSWLHLVSDNQLDTHLKMGYSTYITKIVDTGGTIFSDAILNVKYMFSKSKLDSEVYDYVGISNGIRLYEYKNVLPIGLIYDLSNKKVDLPNTSNPFEVQNYLYKRLLDTEENIMKEAKPSKVKFSSQDADSLVYTLSIKDKSYLYFWVDTEMENSIFEISVDDEVINIPILNSYINTGYPNTSNNGILNLGLYENEELQIKVITQKDMDASLIHFSTLEIEQYEKMFDVFSNQDSSIEVEGNKIKVNAKINQDNKTIFLPINYDDGWSATLNGETVEVSRVFGNYMGIDLINGENTIELTFVPKNLKLGIIISVSTLGIMLIYVIFKKFFVKIIDNVILHRIAYILYLILTILFYVIVYVISIIQTLISFII